MRLASKFSDGNILEMRNWEGGCTNELNSLGLILLDKTMRRFKMPWVQKRLQNSLLGLGSL